MEIRHIFAEVQEFRKIQPLIATKTSLNCPTAQKFQFQIGMFYQHRSKKKTLMGSIIDAIEISGRSYLFEI